MNASPSAQRRSRLKYLLLVVPAALGLAMVWLLQLAPVKSVQDTAPATVPTASAATSAVDGYEVRWLPPNFVEIGRGSERTRLSTVVASPQPAGSAYVPPAGELLTRR